MVGVNRKAKGRTAKQWYNFQEASCSSSPFLPWLRKGVWGMLPLIFLESLAKYTTEFSSSLNLAARASCCWFQKMYDKNISLISCKDQPRQTSEVWQHPFLWDLLLPPLKCACTLRHRHGLRNASDSCNKHMVGVTLTTTPCRWPQPQAFGQTVFHSSADSGNV